MHILLLYIIFQLDLGIIQKTNEDFNVQKYKKFDIENKSILLDRSSGLVYQIFNDTVLRIDKSYDDKIHNGSLDFVKNDTLYRFGGYGYFNSNKNLIRYEFNSNQWSLVPFKNFSLIEGFSYVKFHFLRENKLFVIGYDYNNGKIQNSPNFKNEGFEYDFKTNSIVKKLEIRNSFEYPNSYFQIDNENVFLFYPNKNKLLVLKTTNYDLYEYNLNSRESSISNKKNEGFHLKGDKLYFNTTDINGKDEEVYIHVSNVLNNMTKVSNLLESKTIKYFIFFLLIIVPFLFFYRRKSKLNVTKTELKYRGEKIKIDEKMYQIINLLFDNTTVTNHQLNELFNKKNLNNIHVNRIKNQYIDNINLLFYSKTSKYLILKERSKDDKRFYDFFINKNL